MRITKCDLCKKEIKKEPVTAGIGFFPKAELCEKCGSSILKFLRKNKFIKEDEILKNIKKLGPT
jgi:hypothetical protein